jgi:cbb3-type cytochrome oxidase cytochrome c subunit
MLNGEGNQVGPDLSDEGDRHRTGDWLIGHFQNPGAYIKGSIMPATTNLNRQQLQALAAFLQKQTRSAPTRTSARE